MRIRTELGRETVAALTHPFLTPEGWIKAGDLRTGMALASLVIEDGAVFNGSIEMDVKLPEDI